MLPRLLPLAVLLSAALGVPRIAVAQMKPRLEVELVTEAGATPTAAQQWYKVLTAAKVDDLRVHAGASSTLPDVTASYRAGVPVYKVVGVVNRSGDLVLPSVTFRPADKARLAEWLAKVRQQGPDALKVGERLPFGLAKDSLEQFRADLSRPLKLSTSGMRPVEFIHQVADILAYPLSTDTTSAARLNAAEPLVTELRGTSLGTSLAYVLGQAGLGLVPRVDDRRQPSYTIVSLRDKLESWPVGYPPQQPRRDLVPSLFDTVDVELDQVEIPRVLSAVGAHVSAPVLVDYAALQREKIDLDQVKVSLPAKRSMYEIILRKVLIPQRLAHEVRVDDAQRPFIWVSTVRQVTELKSKEAAR